MNANGIIETDVEGLKDVTNEQVITWYKNMITGTRSRGCGCKHAPV